MSVKTIFKVLIGTVFIIVASCLCVELFNVNTSAIQLKSACNMSANQAAELFTQETYKQINSATGVGGAVNMPNVTAPDGSTYISGTFYNSTSSYALWQSIYALNDNFKKVSDLTQGGSTYLDANLACGTRKVAYTFSEASSSCFNGNAYVIGGDDNSIKTVYSNVAKLYAALYNHMQVQIDSSVTITYNDFISNSAKVARKSFATSALAMRNNRYTPVNIGFPYFDPTVTNRMFQWNLAQLLSNGATDSIMVDETGKKYVVFNGFRCYVSEAYITNFNYYIYDAHSSDGKLALKSKVALSSSELNGLTSSENDYVTVVGIEYTIPVSYQGITPLKNIFEYAWRSEVRGAQDNAVFNSIETTVNRAGSGTYNYTPSSLTNSTNANNGAFSTTGEIYYVLVR